MFMCSSPSEKEEWMNVLQKSTTIKDTVLLDKGIHIVPYGQLHNLMAFSFIEFEELTGVSVSSSVAVPVTLLSSSPPTQPGIPFVRPTSPVANGSASPSAAVTNERRKVIKEGWLQKQSGGGFSKAMGMENNSSSSSL
jgi:hypothetical protein